MRLDDLLRDEKLRADRDRWRDEARKWLDLYIEMETEAISWRIRARDAEAMNETFRKLNGGSR